MALVAAILLGATACGDAPVEPPAEELLLRVTVVAGDDQTGAAGLALVQPVTAVVTGAGGAPAAGVEVVWHVLEGGGWTEPQRGVTDASGRASTTWTLGDDFGRHLLHAVPGEGGTGATFRAWADLFFTAAWAGWRHSCGLDPGGRAWCWGNNQWGQLGNGTTGSSPVSQRVAGGHAFVSLAVGRLHTCGLTADGGAFCWGDNGLGQLADGTNVNRLTPVPMTAGPAFHALALGLTHACGVDGAGALFCWGGNGQGQTGVASTDTCSVFGLEAPCVKRPVQVSLPSSVVRVAAGEGHTCALTADGRGWCWGENGWGQLGVGRFGGTAPAPEAVLGDVRFQEIAAGAQHTCALDLDGAAWCWGRNTQGTLGADSLELHQDRPRPVDMPPGVSFTALGVGDAHACARGSDGAVWCWGAPPASGRPQAARTPVKVAGEVALQTLSVGGAHACGYAEGVWCWGGNSLGQLGVPADSVASALAPLKVRPSPPR